MIDEINGQLMGGVTYAEAVRWLRDSGSSVRLLIRRQTVVPHSRHHTSSAIVSTSARKSTFARRGTSAIFSMPARRATFAIVRMPARKGTSAIVSRCAGALCFPLTMG